MSLFLEATASELGRQLSNAGDIKTPGAPSTIAEEAVDQLQENEKLVAGLSFKTFKTSLG